MVVANKPKWRTQKMDMKHANGQCMNVKFVSSDVLKTCFINFQVLRQNLFCAKSGTQSDFFIKNKEFKS